MKVKDLISALALMPQDADVTYLWDGHARSNIEHVWLANADRPTSAPQAEEEPYWQTQADPNETDDA